MSELSGTHFLQTDQCSAGSAGYGNHFLQPNVNHLISKHFCRQNFTDKHGLKLQILETS